MPTKFNPFDAEQAHGAWALLAEFREQSAVVEVSDGMAYVTRHPECRQLLRDTEGFSSAQGFKAPGVVVPLEDRTLGELDPPNHTVVRHAMVTALTPKSVGRAEHYIESSAHALLDALPDAGEADLVPTFSAPLPNASTVHLLGFPESDAPQIMTWAKDLIESGFPGTHRNREGVEGFRDGFPDFAGYIDDRIEERRTKPTRRRHDEADRARSRRRAAHAAPAPGDGPQSRHRRAHDHEPAPRELADAAVHRSRARGPPAHQPGASLARHRREPSHRAAGDVAAAGMPAATPRSTAPCCRPDNGS